jgi:hypothetical protein
MFAKLLRRELLAATKSICSNIVVVVASESRRIEGRIFKR